MSVQTVQKASEKRIIALFVVFQTVLLVAFVVLTMIANHGNKKSLALAAAASAAARVVECSSVTASGLAAVSTAELGLHESGWTRGTRDGV